MRPALLSAAPAPGCGAVTCGSRQRPQLSAVSGARWDRRGGDFVPGTSPPCGDSFNCHHRQWQVLRARGGQKPSPAPRCRHSGPWGAAGLSAWPPLPLPLSRTSDSCAHLCSPAYLASTLAAYHRRAGSARPAQPSRHPGQRWRLLVSSSTSAPPWAPHCPHLSTAWLLEPSFKQTERDHALPAQNPPAISHLGWRKPKSRHGLTCSSSPDPSVTSLACAPVTLPFTQSATPACSRASGPLHGLSPHPTTFPLQIPAGLWFLTSWRSL